MFYFDVQANIENSEVQDLLLRLKKTTKQLVFWEIIKRYKLTKQSLLFFF